MVLRHRITRIIAFLISCVLVGAGALSALKIVDKSRSFYDGYDRIPKQEISDDMNELYRKLWIIGVMYLRNCDGNGNFKGTKELEENTITELQRLGCMNENGKLVLTGNTPQGYIYSVSYGDAEFTNTDEEIENKEYTFRRYEDCINVPSMCSWSYSVYDFNWYETNYGMTYYEMPGRGAAIYDFDTDGLNSFKDESGAVIYYKLDGTTPIPDKAFEYEDESYNAEISEEVLDNPIYYDENGNPINEIIYDEHGNIVYNHTSVSAPDEGSIYVYRGGEFQKVKSEKFTQNPGSEQPLTISIRPNAGKIAEYEEYAAASSAFDKDMVHSIVNCIPLFAAAFIFMIYFFVVGGYSSKEKKFAMGYVDHLFAEIPAAAAALTVVAVTVLAQDYIYYDIINFFRNYYSVNLIIVIYAAVFSVLFAVFVLCMNSIIIRIKCRSLLKTSALGKIFTFIYRKIRKIIIKLSEARISRDMIKNNRIVRHFVLRMLLALFLEIIVTVIGLGCEEFAVFVIGSVIVLAMYIYLSISDIKAMDRLCSHISDMNSGNYVSRKEEQKSLIYVPTEKLNNISAGIQTAVDRQLKSERMKIDLVTNVSHDLKTPLTSIISYIDLLSLEELEPSARDYVTVIQQKSEQLKIMVADLFDLAKASSRTDVHLEQIDAVILTEQVLADSEDRIKASGKELRRDIQIKTAPITADGKRMYRVLQNLIDNALKYSLDGTRIYLTVADENGECVISLKNIASYEMTFSPDEITERFTRGDKSRTTDGNGLGLSIAKSFTEASGGQFGISVDGDLFKAEIRFKCLST